MAVADDSLISPAVTLTESAGASKNKIPRLAPGAIASRPHDADRGEV